MKPDFGKAIERDKPTPIKELARRGTKKKPKPTQKQQDFNAAIGTKNAIKLFIDRG